MENYSENRTAHLEEYAKENNLPVGGSFNSKDEHGHILKIEEGQSQEDVIQQFNILGNYPLDGLKEIHKCAHNLKSSQILCYNYFRSMIDGAMIDGKGHPTQELIDWVGNHIGVKITNKAGCEFEYVEDKKEYTHFDFYIEEGDVKVFFEIKYTEDGFGKAENDDSHIRKFNNGYTKMLQKCQCLKDNRVVFDEFRRSYQLYRNVLRVTDKNKYVVFIFPKENEIAYKQYEDFKGKINSEYDNNVKALYWEDIVDKDSELYKKYFAE